MKASLFTMIVTTMATALAAAETVNFDDMKVGTVPPGWTATQTGTGAGEMVCRQRRFGAEQAERVEAIRSGDVSSLHQERHEHQRRICRGEIQASCGQGGSGWRCYLASARREQLLHRARQRARKQRDDLLHNPRQAHREKASQY